MDLLNRHKDSSASRAVNSVIRRSADALTNLAHENSSIKTRVRFASFVCYLKFGIEQHFVFMTV